MIDAEHLAKQRTCARAEQWIAAWNAHNLDAIVEQSVLIYACSSESSCLAFS